MSVLTIPNTFVTGTTIQSSPFNQNFNAVATAVNNIDNSNIGAAGLYASQILPTSAAQATFGGALGYTFLAPSAGVTPLTVSGVTSQTADLFDVTLTSGGTKALAVASAGAVYTGNVAPQFSSAQNLGVLNVSSGNLAGLIVLGNGSNSQAGYVQLASGAINIGPTFNSSTFFTIASNAGQVAGALYATALGAFSLPGSAGSGDLIGQRTASTGAFNLGGATRSMLADFNINNLNALTIQTTGVGFTPIFAGAYTNSSDAKFKTNIAPIANALETLLQLKPSSYDWIADGQPDLGFMAQDVDAVLPQIVRTSLDGSKGIVYTGFAALNTAAIQEVVAKLKAAGVAGF